MVHDLELPNDTTASTVARRAVREVAVDGTDGGALDDFLVIVSELVTNAVEHGEGPVHLTLESEPARLAVSVVDHHRCLPRIADPHEDETRGRGLRIVDALAEAWGVTFSRDNGKVVWATVVA